MFQIFSELGNWVEIWASFSRGMTKGFVYCLLNLSQRNDSSSNFIYVAERNFLNALSLQMPLQRWKNISMFESCFRDVLKLSFWKVLNGFLGFKFKSCRITTEFLNFTRKFLINVRKRIINKSFYNFLSNLFDSKSWKKALQKSLLSSSK